MAYTTFSKDENEQNGAPAVQASALPAAPSGPPAAVASGAAPGTAATPAARSGAPTSFVGFDRYFAGNKAAAGQMAQNVAGKVDAATSTAQTSAGADVDKAKTQVNAGVTNPTITQTPGVDGAPDTFTSNAGVYAGPTTFDYSTGTQGQVRAARDLANNLGNQAGLETFYQNEGAGSRRLDAALTGMAGGGAFNQSRRNFDALRGYLSAGAGQFDTALADARARQDLANKAGVEDAAARTAGAQAAYRRMQQARAEELDRQDLALLPGASNIGRGRVYRNNPNENDRDRSRRGQE